MNKSFCFMDRINSFKFAFAGIFTMLKTQHNCWIHLLATIIVASMALFLKVSLTEWCLLIISVVAVWVAEAFNTAFEFLADVASPEFHPLVKKAKDVAAGAVLIAVFGAVIIGLLIFVPYIVAK